MNEIKPEAEAMAYLRQAGVNLPNLEVGRIEPYSWGWIVSVNTKQYWETKDPMKMVIGLSPIFVSKNGLTKIFPTGISKAEMQARFLAQLDAQDMDNGPSE